MDAAAGAGAGAGTEEEAEEEESTATIGPASSRSTPLAHLLRRRRQTPPEAASAPPPPPPPPLPSLNYAAPFMSIRTPAHSAAARPSLPPPPPQAAMKLSCELSREPLRRAGTVPFAWEQSPGRRKPQSPPPPPPPPPPIVTLRDLFSRHNHTSSSSSSSSSISDPSRSPAASSSTPPRGLDCGRAVHPPPAARPSTAARPSASSSYGGADDNDSCRDSYTSALELDDHMSASVLSTSPAAAAASAAAIAMDGRLPPSPPPPPPQSQSQSQSQSETGNLLLLHRFLPAAHALACSSSTDHRPPHTLPWTSTHAMDVLPARATADLHSHSPPRPDLIPVSHRIINAHTAIDSARYSASASAAAAAITTTSDDDEDDDCAAAPAADPSSCGLLTLMRVRGSLITCAGASFCSPARHPQSMARSPSSCHSPPHAIASSSKNKSSSKSSPLGHRQPSPNQIANPNTSKMLEKPLKLRSEGRGGSPMRIRDFLLYDGETVPVSSTINMMEGQSLISACVSNGSEARICADSSFCCSSSSQYSDSPRANDELIMNPVIDATNPGLNHERLSNPSTISRDHGFNSSNGGSDGSVISSSGSSSSNYRRSIHGANHHHHHHHLMMMSPKAAWMESIGSPPLPRSPTQSWLHGSRSTAGVQSRLGRGSRGGQVEGGSEPSKSDAPMDATWEAIVRGAHVGRPGHLRFSEELHQQPKKISTLEIGG